MGRVHSISTVVLGLCVTTFAHAQGVVRNGYTLTEFFGDATRGRVDVVCIGDSNQLHYGAGWDRAWARALQRRLGIYATGVITQGEGEGAGAGVGDGYGVIAVGEGAYLTNQAPDAVESLFNAARADLEPHSYAYLPAGSTTSRGAGIRLYNTAPFDVNDTLRFHFTYGVFGGTGPGSFQPTIRSEIPTSSEMVRGPLISTREGPEGSLKLRSGFLELPGSQRPQELTFRFAPVGSVVTGPFVAFATRIEQVDARKGASLHTLYAKGSQSARDMAAALQACDDATLTLFFSQVRMLGASRVLVRINTGVNDRTESLASVGPERVQDGSSPAAYADNLIAIIMRVQAIWRFNGWDETRLHFLITPSHPVTMPELEPMIGFRDAARSVADRFPHVASVDFSRLIDAYRMLTLRWYYAPFDFNHLSELGFDSLSRLELDALMRAASCPADLDDSGGADGDDLVEFFTRWERGAMDFNDDGATDGDDVIAFFGSWDIGCP